jgi:hypothetical protein
VRYRLRLVVYVLAAFVLALVGLSAPAHSTLAAASAASALTFGVAALFEISGGG